jgi:putative holliday junction resolvase
VRVTRHLPVTAAGGSAGQPPLQARRRPDIPVALGLDAGSVRVGLAATDPTATIASPLATLPRRDAAALWGRVREEARVRRADRVVVGLPRRLDGSEGDAAAAARALAGEAARETGLPVELWDERFSTVAAERALIEAGMRRERRRRTIDAVAAAIMLQGWLDARRGKAVIGGADDGLGESPLRARQRPDGQARRGR